MNFLFIASIILELTFSQPFSDGIFIVTKPAKKKPCEQELKMLIGGQKICLLTKPIVTADGFEYSTDILYSEEQKVNYINLGLKSRSVTTLNQTTKLLPDTEFALVVDANIICTFTIVDHLDFSYISIGDDLSTKDLMIVRDVLKKFRN